MKDRRNLSLKIAIIGVAFFCAFLLRKSFESELLSRGPLARSSPLLPEDKAFFNRSDEHGSSMLLDTILSIIQSYYVDPDRVVTRELALNALRVLSQSKRVSFQRSGDRILLKTGSETYDLDLPESPSFEQTVEFYRFLAHISERYKIQLTSSSTKEEAMPYVSHLINAVLKSLDAHSSLLSPEAYLELRQGTEGSFGGLGVLVGMRDQILTVLKPIPGSPAQKAGIHKNDRILGINGVFTFGKSLESLVEHMRGDPGSVVHLSLLKFGAKAPADMSLRREIVQVDSVLARDVTLSGQKFLHLTIENFAARTSREVRNALDTFRAAQKGRMPGVILDLRGNPGGLLDQAVQVADIFLPSGAIVSTKGRREELESAVEDRDETGYPLMVLIDEDSASASEIVAGALQDHGRGLVIGQPSFGKGSVQTIFELPDDRALKLTIARYFTPSGRSIQNTGITPDIWLQPVLMRERNLNLLGDQRYQNERFLQHHLDVFQDQQLSWIKPHHKKAYYLIPEHNRNDDSSKGSDHDQELALAGKILEKVYAVYGTKTGGSLPVAASRASHWMALAGPEISKNLLDMDSRVSQWLEQKHHISWATPKEKTNAPHIFLTIDDETAGEAELGGTLAIKWHLKNNEDRPLDRISLYLRSDDFEIESQELFIGKVPPHKTLQGVIQLPIPSTLNLTSTNLSMGVVHDATPLPYIHAEHLVQIRQRPLATLNATFQLTDERGGSIGGVLEQGEKANLRLHIENKGLTPATDLKVETINLAGSQLTIAPLDHAPFKVEPGKGADFTVGITASSIIYSTEMSVGVYVDGKNLKEPLRQRTAIKSQPSRKFSAEKPPSVGH